MAERWQEDLAWSNTFIPHCKQLLGLACIHITAIDQDRKENTDLLFEVGMHRFPVRIRRIQDRLPFNRRNEITFRFSRASGIDTEFDKVLYGWGDGFLYGWGDERSQQVRAYTLLDLNAFRVWCIHYIVRHKHIPGQVQHDRDGSASFLALCLDCLPPSVIKERVTLLANDPPNTDSHWMQYHAYPVTASINER